MASKTKYNIVVGAKLDPTNNLSQQIQSAISKSTYKINIDVAYLAEQINKAFSSVKINIGSGGGTGSSGGGKSREYNGKLNPKTRVVNSLSTTTYFDEENKEIKERISGYDALGHKVTELNRIYQENNETVRQRLSSTKEEGTLLNQNAQTYERLSSRLKSLTKNGQITKKSSQQLTKALEDANKMTDEFGKKARFKEIGQEMSDASKHAMTFFQMLKTAYVKFANFTPKIATSYRNVC